jgi:uncharacterized protein (TIGR02246 family)
MKSLALLCSAAALTLAMTACNNPASQTAQTPPDTHEADVKAITDAETQANSAWATRDADKVLAFYADDAVLMTPGAEALKGKDAIKSDIGGMLADKALSLTFKSTRVDVAKSGDLGYTQGDYQLAVTDPASHKVVHDHGTYVTTFRKQPDGSWRAVADIATSAVPPAPQKH